MRLDAFLQQENEVASRNKAQEMIANGFVRVNGNVITKASYKIDSGVDYVEIAENLLQHYVSRSAVKLHQFLKELAINISGMHCIDVGASTGGFTQVLLEHQVKQVDCVDVGRAQLHEQIKRDSRVAVFESCDIRQFSNHSLYDLVVCDVSFISLSYLLEHFNALSKQWIIMLFKPQFELGKEIKRDKHGVIDDEKAIKQALQRFETLIANSYDWELVMRNEAAIKGKMGNQEYCYAYRRT